ncbi:MAG: MBL fold metallo-hydrolase [Nitrospinota bacterium]|nr:MBL fold metallo-hydrolase [Nitrospinota bacterium]
MVGCGCDVCHSSDPRDRRLRSSIWIESADASLLVDTTTDLRAQALRANILRVDAVLYTHHHADHVHGVDELRAFNYFQGGSIPCYGNQKTLERIRELHGYIFDGRKAEGAAKPRLELCLIDGPLDLGSTRITPIPVKHGTVDAFGYRIANTAYITDCSFIPEESYKLLEGLETLALGALWLERHATHFTMEKALAAVERIRPGKTYLTHLNHARSHRDGSAALPENVHLAWDGLVVEF